MVFALYYPGNKDAVQQYGDQLFGKVVVDISNPVDTNTGNSLATAPGTSAAEELQGLVPEGTPVVKVFNTTFAATLARTGLPDSNSTCSWPATTPVRRTRSRS